MSLVGKLEELPLPDLLQIITSNAKSGKLILTRHDAQGLLVFGDGKIVYAASTSARETLGHLLLSEGLITESQLLAALERQHRESDEKRLGTILLEDGSLAIDDLTRVLEQQIRKVVAEFLAWESGYFKFDTLRLAERQEIEVDAKDFLLESGLATDTVLLDFTEKMTALDEPASASVDVPTGLASLKALMAEIRSPEFTGEVGLKILNYAQQILPRTVLFFVRQNLFIGLGKRAGGLPDRDNANIAKIKIPCEGVSILSDAAGLKATCRGPLDPTEWNLYLISKLGGIPPGEAVALPMIVNQKVLLVLYGDDAGQGEPLPTLEDLELLVLQAGLAMEKTLLEKRIEQFEKLRTG